MELYRLQLVDYASPSFWSGYADYYGTSADIQNFLSCLEKMNNQFSECQKLKELSTSGSGFELVELIAVSQKNVENYFHVFMNVWDCPYYIHAENLKADLALVAVGNKYVICCKPSFTDAYYGPEPDEKPYPWEYFTRDTLWGHPGMYKIEDERILTSRFYFPEAIFEKKEEAVCAFESFDINNCDSMYADIFGDG